MMTASITERARPKEPPQFGRIVSNDDVSKALDWLRDSAADLGKAKERATNAANYVKHVEALLFLSSDEKSAEARKADARTQQRWLNATTEEGIAAGELAKLYALREAASARIEAWRSEQANFRSMRV